MDFKVIIIDGGATWIANRLKRPDLYDPITKFKLGEGGWSTSSLWTQEVGASGSTDYSGTLSWRLPIARNEFELTDGTLSLTDDGLGGLTGDGSGTINYKTGVFTATFSSTTTAAVDAKFKYWGKQSAQKKQVLLNGSGLDDYYSKYINRLPVYPGTVIIYDSAIGAQILTDTANSPYDGAGVLSGDGVGDINYETGLVRFKFTNTVPATSEIYLNHSYDYAPDNPVSTRTNLVAHTDANLYIIEKDFYSLTLDGIGTGKITVPIRLEPQEGIDDGNGLSPVFFEGGLFADATMVAYFTFSRIKKDGGVLVNMSLPSVV
jgi:hypothetical protein